jgi:5-methyltetrahydropteroyltriglutamate--homocysteine methyltransferase
MPDHPLQRLRVDHIGSLLRPKALIDAFLAHGRKAIDQETLDRAADEAIRKVVARQEAIGLPIVSDGEFRRLNWQVSFSVVEGWDQWAGAWKAFLANPSNMYPGEQPLTRGQDAVETFKAPATAKLSLTENFPLREFSFLESVAKVPAKTMLMGPDRVAQMCDIGASAPHYTSADQFLADVVAIQHQMVAELIEAGCGYIQLDEPSYTGYVDRATLERIKLRGEDPMANLTRAIRASNAVIAGHKSKPTFAIHICRGNRASMWHRDGTYDGIAEELFSSLAFDRLLLEYDTERAGGFEPLRFVPKGRMVVLGLITTKTGTLETVDGLRRRIDDAGRFIDLGQLALSPQCGFASGIAGNRLGEDDQWRKLDLMLETARRVWG